MKFLRLINFLTQADPLSSADGDFWRNLARFKFRNGTTTETIAFLSDIKIRREYHFSFLSTANNVVGQIGKESLVNNANPATGFPTTKGGATGSGLADGNSDPYLIINDCIVKTIRLTLGQACVNQGTVGASPTIRISLWKLGLHDTRTLLANFDIPLMVLSGTIGVNGNLSTVLATGILNSQTVSVSAGDTIGIEFNPLLTNNNQIRGIGRMVCVVETEE